MLPDAIVALACSRARVSNQSLPKTIAFSLLRLFALHDLLPCLDVSTDIRLCRRILLKDLGLDAYVLVSIGRWRVGWRHRLRGRHRRTRRLCWPPLSPLASPTATQARVSRLPGLPHGGQVIETIVSLSA